MKMTILEMRNEIKRIRRQNALNLDVKTVLKISDRKDELMKEMGYTRFYMNKNERKKFVEDYLVCYINANYDITGECL